MYGNFDHYPQLVGGSALVRRSRKFGSALLLTMTMLFVLTMIIGAVGNMSQMNTSSVAVKRWQKQARFAGYAGLQDALARINVDPTYNSPIPATPLDGDPDTLYQVEIFNNFGSTTGQYAPDQKTWVPPGQIYLYSIGMLPGRQAQASSGYVSIAGVQRPRFDLAVYCDSGLINMTNSNVVVWDINNILPAGAQIAHVGSSLRTGFAIQSNSSNVQGKLICARIDAGHRHQRHWRQQRRSGNRLHGQNLDPLYLSGAHHGRRSHHQRNLLPLRWRLRRRGRAGRPNSAAGANPGQRRLHLFVQLAHPGARGQNRGDVHS